MAYATVDNGVGEVAAVVVVARVFRAQPWQQPIWSTADNKHIDATPYAAQSSGLCQEHTDSSLKWQS